MSRIPPAVDPAEVVVAQVQCHKCRARLASVGLAELSKDRDGAGGWSPDVQVSRVDFDPKRTVLGWLCPRCREVSDVDPSDVLTAVRTHWRGALFWADVDPKHHTLTAPTGRIRVRQEWPRLNVKTSKVNSLVPERRA